jgi:hypothetical protein
MDNADLDNRFTYHAPGDKVAQFQGIRREARDLAATMNDWCPEGREKSLAITKLEEAVMWANAAIARNE